jgi:hypothetical protein
MKVDSPEVSRLNRDGLIIAMDLPVFAETIHPQSMQLLVERTEREDSPFQFACYCNVRVKVAGMELETPACGDEITDVSVDDMTAGPVHGARLRPVHTNNDGRDEPVKLVAGRYRVVVEGDFIVGVDEIEIPDPTDLTKTIKVHPALDANHLGPGLLPKGTAGPAGLARRCPTGDGVEGGRFVSWFRIQ